MPDQSAATRAKATGDAAGRSIILIGFMGCGKSSVGRLIARRLRYRFFDTDEMVVRATGRQISDLFAQEGEPFFRDQETLALESLAGREGVVAATGGGIVLRERNVVLLHELGFVVWLTASEEVIYERVRRNTRRPLVQTANPRETIVTLLTQRAPLYTAAAQFTIDTSHRSHSEVASLVVTEAKRFFDRRDESSARPAGSP